MFFKRIWQIVTISLITSIIVSGSVFWWQRVRLKAEIERLRKRINDLEEKERAIAELQKTFPILKDKLSDWFSNWQTIVLGFNFQSFSWQGDTTITQQVISFNPNERSFQLKTPFYNYSPDQSKFLDIYLGMEVWEEAGKLKVGYGPDHGVALGDLKTNQLKVLLFCGTAGNYDNSLWLDNDNFVVTGFTEYFSQNEEEKQALKDKVYYIALLYFFNLSKNKMTVYYGPKVEGKFFQRIYLRSLRERFKSQFPNVLTD
uniref:LapA family protein n=1 Tax=candidate division WOR-3 bacterium TaxID=2052148 RepID=A0A7C6ECW2_UNCW3